MDRNMSKIDTDRIYIRELQKTEMYLDKMPSKKHKRQKAKERQAP